VDYGVRFAGGYLPVSVVRCLGQQSCQLLLCLRRLSCVNTRAFDFWLN
jgi:hypothetical protein